MQYACVCAFMHMHMHIHVRVMRTDEKMCAQANVHVWHRTTSIPEVLFRSEQGAVAQGQESSPVIVTLRGRSGGVEGDGVTACEIANGEEEGVPNSGMELRWAENVERELYTKTVSHIIRKIRK